MASQILLPNGCVCSTLCVFPSNWKTKKANPLIEWRITYRFYDSSGKVFQKKLQGMNRFKILSDKQAATQSLLDVEMKALLQDDYNPVKNTFKKITYSEIDRDTPFIEALKIALKKMKGVRGTLIDMASTVNGIAVAAKKMEYTDIEISRITKKHITRLLEKCAEIRPKWSPKRHNMYRAWLMKLFKYLVSVEAIDYNPVRDTEKLIEIRKLRETLTMEEREKINLHLHKHHYLFWRFMMVFFYSGARITELMQVRTGDVDLTKQAYKCLIRKGRQYEWKWRPISNTILYLWKEIMAECKEGDYLWSKDLKPGGSAIRPDQIGRRWNHWVIKKFGVKASFYSLKHTYTTEIATKLSDEEAALQNAHRGTGMVVKIYDVTREKRQMERLKNVEVRFS